MLLISGGKELESYYVAHIIPGTPAALAGIKEQDQILKVNRLPVSFLSLSSINSILQKEEGKNKTYNSQEPEEVEVYILFKISDLILFSRIIK